MYISKIRIKGFRSFGPEVEIQIKEKLTAFIGHNSSGKTTALEALRKIFGAHSEREIAKDDFHIDPSEDRSKINRRDLFIEIRFDFDKDDKDAFAHFSSDMVIDGAGKPLYLRVRLEANWTESAIHQDGDIDIKTFFIIVPEGQTEKDDSKRLFPNYLRGLIQVLYVPAIRKPSDQIKYASGSMLYRVLRKVKWDDKFRDTFDKKIKDIEKLFAGLEEFGTIQTSINSFWNQFHKDSRFKETSLGFGQSDFESVLKRMEITFSPTATDRPFHVDELGEGYRSLFYLTLVCSLLEIEDKLSTETDEIGITRPLLTLLAVEEPENHIAPQVLGRVTKILQKISSSSAAQIFLSSHTPSIVRRIPPESICHFRVSNFATVVKTIVLPDAKDEAYKYVKEAIHHYPEMYFAKLVVIGEGDSEEVILGRLMEVMDVDFDDNMITFAPLGHRFVHHIWRLLRVLRIPFVTILDLDVERTGGGWGRIHYALQQLIDLGISRDKLLEVGDKGHVLNDEEFEELKKRKIDLADMKAWTDFLEGYQVYFSAPMDIDFLMLEAYTSFYHDASSGKPRIPDKGTEKEKYDARILAGVQAALKSETAKGSAYSIKQKELMTWYQYLFLGRGKPVTHILTLSDMTDKDIKENLPLVLSNLFKSVKKILAKT